MNNTDSLKSLMGIITRPGIDELATYCMSEESGYLTAPSSSAYRGAHEGGNLKHSVLVTETMLDLRQILAPEIPFDSCVICGLFHDLGKAHYYGKPNYVPNVLKGGTVSESKPYNTNPDRLPIPHQVASLQILSRYIELTEEETYAILYHNGLYTPDGRAMAGKETKLLLLLHWADMYASRFLEVG